MPKQSRSPDFKVPRSALMTWVFAYDPKPGKGQHEIRDNLKTIHFESSVEGPRKDAVRKLHAVATNGHRLIHCWWEAGPDDVLDSPFEVESEAVDYFLKNLNEGEDDGNDKPKKGGSVLSRGRDFQFKITTENGNYILSAEKDSTPIAWVDVGLIEHAHPDFPAWRSCIPKWQEEKEIKRPTTFGVDFDYVLDFHRFLKEFGYGTNMKISNVEALSPILFAPTCQSEEDPTVEVDFLLLDQATSVEYLLMPLRQ